GRLDLEGVADLPHRRPVAARLDLVADEVVNLPLAIRQLAEVRHRTPLWKWTAKWNAVPAALRMSISSETSSTLLDVNLSILDASTQRKGKSFLRDVFRPLCSEGWSRRRGAGWMPNEPAVRGWQRVPCFRGPS